MFAIYFPGRTGSNPKHFHDVGLADLLDDTPPDFCEWQPGPDNLPGVAASWAGRPIIPGEFDWTPIRGGQVWLGKHEGKPKPEWFARQHRQLGTDMRFADGEQWHIPVARQLPRLLGLDDGGQLTSKIVPHYERFWTEAWAAIEWFQPDERGRYSVDYKLGYEFVCLALSINYRVNRDVASWLGLVSSDLFFRVVDAVTELTELLELQSQKKTAEAASVGQPTSAGAEG